MKIFILCGGSGTRLDSLGKVIAKPMVRIGKEPMLKHIIDNFVSQKLNEFVLCTGHKANTILDYFIKEKKKFVKIISKKKNNIEILYKDNKIKFICNLVYTGKDTGTGGRIKLAYKILKLNEDIFMTYGDGLSNLNIKKLINFHYKHKSDVTMTAVRPKHKYGIIKIKNKQIYSFDDSKSGKSTSFINGGFFVISKASLKLIKNIKMFWENEPLKNAITKGKTYAFKHNDFWQSVDTLKDLSELNELYKKKLMPWIYHEK